MKVTPKICQVYAKMSRYCIVKSTWKILRVIVRNAAWLCNLELQTGKQYFKSSRQLQLQYSMFIEIRNKRICVCGYLSRKYSVLFSLVDCLKVKCDEVFLKIHEECKTNVMWSSIVVVFPSEEHWLSFPE